MSRLRRLADALSRRSLILCGIVIAGLLLTLLVNRIARPSGATTETPVTILAESTAVCFGVTARLALVSADDRIVSAPPSMLRGARWRLELTVPADMPATEEVKASLDTFTIRGSQGTRDDLVLLRAAGQAWPLTTEGVGTPRRDSGEGPGPDSGLDSDVPWQLRCAWHHLWARRPPRGARSAQSRRATGAAMSGASARDPDEEYGGITAEFRYDHPDSTCR